MATVRMSRKLIYDLKRAYDDRILKKLHAEKEFNPALADSIYNSLIGRRIETFRTALADSFGDLIDPEAFFVKSSELDVVTSHTKYRCRRKKDEVTGSLLRDEEEDWEVQSQTSNDRLSFPLSTERSFPAAPPRGYGEPKKLLLNLKREEQPELDTLVLVEEANDRQKAKDTVNVNKFEKFLKQFTTLNQALRAYPALDKLVDADLMAKVHKKQERKRKQEAQKEKAIDLDQSTKLTEDILTASLLGDENGP